MTDKKRSKSEEINLDDPDLEDVGSEPEDTVKEPLEALEEEVKELKDQLLRSVAELDNYRKRAEREKEQLRKFGIANFAKDLLSAADNLRRAVESGPTELEGADENVKNLIVGVEMTEKELLSAFEKNGVRKIDPIGEKFDYNFHQAMFEVETDKEKPGLVMQVLQPGYAIADRVLRPAMVGVSKTHTPDQPEGVDEKV
tara:strand:+ start:183 stop:779 length:597 start_codon:yes stop_codon:yes gene_type:complete